MILWLFFSVFFLYWTKVDQSGHCSISLEWAEGRRERRYDSFATPLCSPRGRHGLKISLLDELSCLYLHIAHCYSALAVKYQFTTTKSTVSIRGEIGRIAETLRVSQTLVAKKLFLYQTLNKDMHQLREFLLVVAVSPFFFTL